MIKVNDVVAKEGAWQRKYLVVAITPMPEKKLEHCTLRQCIVALKPLGTRYAHSGIGHDSTAPMREVVAFWNEYKHDKIILADNEAQIHWYVTDHATTHRYHATGTL